MDFKDYYATLGIAPDASRDQVRRAYRKLARKYHPDVSRLPQTEARFQEVSEAHEALIDPERRAAYDEARLRHERGPALGDGPAGHGTPDEADLGDFFESLFGHGARQRGARAARRMHGHDEHVHLDVDLGAAFEGAVVEVSLQSTAFDAEGRPSLQRRHLQVTIPRGVQAGQQLRLAGQGAPGRAGPPGDLYLEIGFRPHPLYRVEGRDLTMDLPLAPWEAANGTTVEARTPAGSVQLTVPENARPGQKLRLKGRGLPGTPAGDLYALVGIAWPAAPDAAAHEAYAALARAFARFDPRPPGPVGP